MANEPHQHGDVTIYRPEPSSRHPIVLFLLFLTLSYGVSVLFGGPAPGSIEEQLDAVQVSVWGGTLAFGASTYLIALALQSSKRVRTFTTGVAFEQVGAASLGAAAILYSVAVVATVGWVGTFPAGTTFAFGAACIYRWITILRGVRTFARAQHTT